MILPKGTSNGAPVWTQPNVSDRKGDLWSSFNLDTIENEGTLRLGKRLVINTSNILLSQLTAVPVAFISNSASIFAFAGASNVGYAFKNDATMIGTFNIDTTTGYPTTIDSTKSDACFSNGAIYVSAKASASNNVSLYKKTFGGNWSEITTTEANGSNLYTNMLCSYGTRTYMTNSYSKIISLDSSDTPSYSNTYTLSVGSSSNDPANVITKLLPGDDRIFILTKNLYGGQGNVYEWDGATTQGSTSGLYIGHKLESAGALAGVMFEGTPYIMDTMGKLLRWNGGTFIEVATLNRENNLPLVYSPSYSALNLNYIHPNGMTVSQDGKILILINNLNADYAGTIEETINSGVYEFDPHNPAKGLIHKHSVSGNSLVDTINDYGHVRVPAVGAIQKMGITSTASGANGSFLAGIGFYTDATTAKYGIFYDDRNDVLQKAGYLVSIKMPSGVLLSNYNKLTVFFRKLLNATDKIVVKYRTVDSPPVEATITWTSTTTFTTTTNISSYWTAGTGGEVEVLQGVGAGKCSHITNIVNNAGTYTVTVDETYVGATGTAKARFQSWIKKGVISKQNIATQPIELGVVSSWIQFKIWMMWTGKNEIEKLVGSEQISQKIE